MDSLIKAVGAYIDLSPEEAVTLAGLFSEIRLKAGEYFLQEGKVCKNVAFVHKGLLRYFINEAGEERTLFFSKENEFVCDYLSFLPKTPSGMNIHAMEDTLLYIISYEHLQLLYRDIRGGERFGRLAIEQLFVYAIQQLNSMYVDPPEKRYRRFLTAYPDLAQRLPQYYIASYVGIKPPSLSRIRKRMSIGFHP